jgi:hypothetical protein
MGPKKDNEQILQKIRERRARKAKKRRKHYLIWKEKNKGVSADVLKLKKNIENSRKVKFPIVFSLRDNIRETIKFINNLKELKESKKSIYLNMKCVEKITNGTIALLLSVINDPSFDGINIIGSKPKNKEARKILELSGFYEHTQATLEFDNENNSNTIIAKSRKAVEPQRSATIVRNAMKTITNKEQRNKKLQGLFIELMANSINHGFPDNGNKKWLLSASHYALEKRVSFSFIDNGVGILKTLDLKLGKKLISFFTGNNDLLLSAFRGEIGSRTGLDFRGKGLPFILEKQRLGYIVNLFVLTNNVILDFEKNDFYEIDINYSGTFYFFEINNNCKL